jgi:hypothetical protein
MVSSFISKAAHIVGNIGNFMIYLTGKLGTIGNIINGVKVCEDSIQEGYLMDEGKRETITGRVTTSPNFG